MDLTGDRKKRWAVVLAGGDGTRLQGLTHLIYGNARPKQFCTFFGGGSLLANTRERIAPLFDNHQTVFALSRGHQAYHDEELQGVEQRQRFVQPSNRGTAVAIAVCLRTILREDEDAVVAIFPSDHHYWDPAAFQSAVDYALRSVAEYPQCTLLLGAEPTCPETEYGWIQPGRTLMDSAAHPLLRVSRFWEKPGPRRAKRLLDQGCLWNTFVTVGQAAAFWELLQAAVPQLTRLLKSDSFDRQLGEIYEAAAPLDFSKAVLASLPKRLLVLKDARSGWTDLGSPRRVIDVATRGGLLPAWLTSGRKAVPAFEQGGAL